MGNRIAKRLELFVGDLEFAGSPFKVFIQSLDFFLRLLEPGHRAQDQTGQNAAYEKNDTVAEQQSLQVFVSSSEGGALRFL